MSPCLPSQGNIFKGRNILPLSRVSILGVSVDPLDMDLTLNQIENWLLEDARAYACVLPAHSVMECVNHPELLPVFNKADMVTPDGMSIVWLLNLMGYKNVRRVYGPDLMMATCKHGINKKWRHYFFGGNPGTPQALADQLQKQIPDLQIAGTCSPPFGPPTQEEEERFISALNTSKADILWVGMSSPWQETWMHEYRTRVNIPIMIGVGAAFDFLSGRKKQAPRWIQKMGMEWLYRLISESKRLWPRYKNYPLFLVLAIRELITSKKK